MPVSALPAMRAAIAYSAPTASSSVAWYLANGTIDITEIEDYGENVVPATTYAGSYIGTGSPWTIACQVYTWPGSGIGRFWYAGGAFSWIDNVALSQIATRLRSSATWTETYSFTWSDNDVMFWVCDGSTTTTYHNNTALTPAISNNDDLTLGFYWAAQGVGSNEWHENMKKVFCANIALDSTQRAALYASMSA